MVLNPSSLLSKPTIPTLFHQMYWSSSRPAAVLMELGVVNIKHKKSASSSSSDDDDEAGNKKKKSNDDGVVDIVTVTEEQLKNDPMLVELNPQKRLPFFYDPTYDLRLHESGGLIEYLLETYDTNGTLSLSKDDDTDISKRAEYYKLLHFGPATMYHIGVPIMGHDIGFAKLSDEQLATKKEEWNRIVIPTLEYTLNKYGGPYLLGSKFTAVDCSIQYDVLTIASSSYKEELVTSHPVLKSYLDAISERDVYKKLYNANTNDSDDGEKEKGGDDVPADTVDTKNDGGNEADNEPKSKKLKST